jgi:hypothetical protein
MRSVVPLGEMHAEDCVRRGAPPRHGVHGRRGWTFRSALRAGSAVLLLACGGELGSELTSDGAAADVTTRNDATNGVDARRDAFDVSLSPPDANSERSATSDSSRVDVGSFDVGDVVIPVPNSAPFDSCAPDPCSAGKACWTNGIRAGCVGMPPVCEDGSTCACLVAAAPWCLMPSCSDDAGAVVLGCVPVRKGPPPR